MDSSKVLPKGRVLNGSYTIEKVLGAGGFGITYLARRRVGNIKMLYAVKEYFISSICARSGDDVWVSNVNREQYESGKEAFISQARRISKNHIFFNNIVAVDEVFEQNETAYYVMELVEGNTLANYVGKRGGLPPDEALEIFVPLMQAVHLLHSNYILHLDIKPDNVIVGHDSIDHSLRPVLIDFDLSKHYGADGNVSSVLPFISCSEGYAPIEQYELNGVSRFLPQADVYGLAATLLFILTGQGPVISSAFNRDDIPSLMPADTPGYIGRAIYNAMAPSAADRTPTVAQFARDLSLDPRDWPSAVMRDPNSLETHKRRRKKIAWMRVLGVAACLCAVIACICFCLSDSGNSRVVDAFGHKICMVPVVNGTDTFYMADKVVTQKLWRDVTGDDSKHFSFLGDNRPASNMTPAECQLFISKLNEATGMHFRLPTAEEWMLAYHEGVDSMPFLYPGSDSPKKVGWLKTNNPQNVGKLKPNALGLYDMLGNVTELTEEHVPTALATFSKTKYSSGYKYYVCGLNCRDDASTVQPKVNYNDVANNDDTRRKFIGFRLVCDSFPSK